MILDSVFSCKNERIMTVQISRVFLKLGRDARHGQHLKIRHVVSTQHTSHLIVKCLLCKVLGAVLGTQ